MEKGPKRRRPHPTPPPPPLSRCKEGAFRLDGAVGEECRPCPDGAVCLGDVTLPWPRRGHWADLRRAGYLTSHPACLDAGACGGGPDIISAADAGTITLGDVKDSCFGSPALLQSCNTTAMCKDGRRAQLCGVCEESHYYYAYADRCLECAEGRVKVLTVLIVLVVLVVVLSLGLFIIFCTRCLERFMALALIKWLRSWSTVSARGDRWGQGGWRGAVRLR